MTQLPVGTIMEDVKRNLREEFCKKTSDEERQVFELFYDQLFELANPANGRSLKTFKEKIDYTRAGACIYYEKWCGPAIVGCETAAKRRKVANQFRRNILFESINNIDVPGNLKELATKANSLGLQVRLNSFCNRHKVYTRILFINDYRCRPMFRNELSTPRQHKYLLLSINRKAFSKFDFILLKWVDNLQEDVTYIIPTHILKEFEIREHGEQIYYIPIGTQHTKGRRISIDWSFYRNNWKLLQQPR